MADLGDITERVKAKLIEDNHADLLQHITTTLTNADKDHRFFCGIIDLEVILSVLNGIMDPLYSLKDLGPYAIYLNQLKDKNYSDSSPYHSITEEDVRLCTVLGLIAVSALMIATSVSMADASDCFDFKNKGECIKTLGSDSNAFCNLFKPICDSRDICERDQSLLFSSPHFYQTFQTLCSNHYFCKPLPQILHSFFLFVKYVYREWLLLLPLLLI